MTSRFWTLYMESFVGTSWQTTICLLFILQSKSKSHVTNVTKLIARWIAIFLEWDTSIVLHVFSFFITLFQLSSGLGGDISSMVCFQLLLTLQRTTYKQQHAQKDSSQLMHLEAKKDSNNYGVKICGVSLRSMRSSIIVPQHCAGHQLVMNYLRSSLNICINQRQIAIYVKCEP